MRNLFAFINDAKTLTATDLAINTGMLRSSLSNYKYGRTTPNILAVEEIAAALGLRIVLMPVSSVLSADDGQMADGKAE